MVDLDCLAEEEVDEGSTTSILRLRVDMTGGRWSRFYWFRLKEVPSIHRLNPELIQVQVYVCTSKEKGKK